jgi:hypothetical protein
VAGSAAANAAQSPGFLRTALQTTFSRGAGYEELPLGTAFEHGRDGYFVDYSAKTGQPRPDPAGAPIGLIQWALGWGERSAAGEERAETMFLDSARRLLDVAERRGGARLFPYTVPVPKYGIDGSWLSAHAQGQAASVFVRAFRRTGADVWADAASESVVPLLTGGFGLLSESRDGPVLEEAPCRPPSQILNGWITGLWGLFDVAGTLDDPGAAESFREGVDCLCRRIPVYDVGWWTRYSLYPHRIRDLAKPVYHRFHATQLEALARLTGRPDLAATAARWRDYDRPRRRWRALGQKAVFVAARANTPRATTDQATSGTSWR